MSDKCCSNSNKSKGCDSSKKCSTNKSGCKKDDKK